MDMTAHFVEQIRARATPTAEQIAKQVEQERRERQQRQEQNKEYMLRLGVPTRFVDDLYAKDHRVDHKPLGDAMRFWKADRKRVSILLLAGRFGVGKSVAAAQYVKLRTESLDTVPAKLQDVYPCWHYSAQVCWRGLYESKHLDKMVELPVLVIDDLGAEHVDSKGAFASVLTGLVTMRHDRYLPTILTTNMAAEAFKEHYGSDRLFQRIRQSGWYCEQDDTVDIVRKRCDAAGT